MDPSWIFCELGCGRLPSLTAARSGAKQVIATDVDGMALEMVCAAAAMELDLIGKTCEYNDEHDNEQRFITKNFDLTSQDDSFPKADWYILSDVFKSSFVAEGVAWQVQNILTNNRKGGEFSRLITT